MTHPTAWTCRGCGFLLGHVRDGALGPLLPVKLIDSRGLARLQCPRCGETRHWFQSGAVSAAAGNRRAAD